jgi:HPt (histidine-containing phosphotransfer) domain-containing protein
MSRRDLTGAVDFDYLGEYTAGDADLMEEVLGIFEHQVELWMRLLEPQSSPDMYRDGAHTLKGASLGIGARDLAAACLEAEQNSAAHAPARAALTDQVRTRLEAVLSDIAAWRHEQALKSLRS